MSRNFTRGFVAAATSLALVTTAVPAAGAQDVSSNTAASSALLSSVGGNAAYTVVSIGISLAVWGTIYNALVARGTIPGQIIKELPVL